MGEGFSAVAAIRHDVAIEREPVVGSESRVSGMWIWDLALGTGRTCERSSCAAALCAEASIAIFLVDILVNEVWSWNCEKVLLSTGLAAFSDL